MITLLGIEVAQSKEGFIIFQRKYDVRIEWLIVGQFIIIWTHIHVNDKIRKPFLKSKPSISFFVEVVSQFMQVLHDDSHYHIPKKGQGQILYEDKGNTQDNGIDHLWTWVDQTTHPQIEVLWDSKDEVVQW